MRGVWKSQKNIAQEWGLSNFCCKNIYKMRDLELIRGSRGSRGSGVKKCGSDPPFHARRWSGWRESKQTPSNKQISLADASCRRPSVLIWWVVSIEEGFCSSQRQEEDTNAKVAHKDQRSAQRQKYHTKTKVGRKDQSSTPRQRLHVKTRVSYKEKSVTHRQK